MKTISIYCILICLVFAQCGPKTELVALNGKLDILTEKIDSLNRNSTQSRELKIVVISTSTFRQTFDENMNTDNSIPESGPARIILNALNGGYELKSVIPQPGQNSENNSNANLLVFLERRKNAIWP